MDPIEKYLFMTSKKNPAIFYIHFTPFLNIFHIPTLTYDIPFLSVISLQYYNILSFRLLYKDGSKKQIKMVVKEGSEAERLYDTHHDEAVDFRSNDLFEERKVSVKSKAVGLAMRLAGVICLMRVYADRTTKPEIEKKEKDEDKADTQDLVSLLQDKAQTLMRRSKMKKKMTI